MVPVIELQVECRVWGRRGCIRKTEKSTYFPSGLTCREGKSQYCRKMCRQTDGKSKFPVFGTRLVEL
uniref:Uncharacterized protein n=1 Tax=Anguilla anguilla TaxID=7936 RepID=A0A0E9WIL5_ANGAN